MAAGLALRERSTVAEDHGALRAGGSSVGRLCIDPTLAELAAKHGVHYPMIACWKRQASDGMTDTFFGAGDAAEAASESGVEELHAKIGQLVGERRRALVESAHHRLSIEAQCRLLRISRSSFFYAPVLETGGTLALRTVIDEAFMDCPWGGSRQQARHLRCNGGSWRKWV